jgi:cell division transport system permease protein
MKLGYVFGEVAQGLKRNLSMVVSIVLVTFLSLSFVGTAALLQLQIGQMKNYWYDRAQVAVYLCSEYSPAEACPQGEASADVKTAIENKLQDSTLSPYVDKYYFLNHEDALKQFQEEFKDNTITNYVTADQLNETFWVKLKNPSDGAIITQSFTGVAGVEEVRDQRSYLDQIFSILNAASLAAVGIAVVMLFSSILLISTTIRQSAFSRRREIGIMRLVGASNFYIQLPFIIEGVAAAAIGSILAGGTVLAIVQFFVQGYLAQSLPFTNFVDLGTALTLVPIIFGLGIVLAAFASIVAIKRYLRA